MAVPMDIDMVPKMITRGLTTNTSQKRRVTQFSSEEYLANLIKPLDDQVESKIPDMASYPTSTYSQKEEFNFAINANGVGGCQIVIYPAPAYYTETAASTDAVFAYPAGATNFTGNTQIQAVYGRHRLVGAGLEVEYTGNDAQNQGQIFFAYYSRAESAATSQANMQKVRDGCDGPSKFGGYIRYRPRDAADFDMAGTTSNASSDTWCILQVHVTGAAANTQFRVRSVCHWEGIQKDDAYTFNVLEESPINPLQLASVSSVAQKFDSTGLFDQSRNQMDVDFLIGRSYLILMGAPTAQASNVFL